MISDAITFDKHTKISDAAMFVQTSFRNDFSVIRTLQKHF